MSIVKHLNGHIPIIPANFNHNDSCVQESVSSNKELPSYNELFIDQKRVQSRSLHEKTPSKLFEISSSSIFQNFRNLDRSNRIMDKNCENISFSSASKNFLPKVNIKEDNNLFEQMKNIHKPKKSNKANFSHKNDPLEKTMNALNFQERLNFLKNSEISLRRSSFWKKFIQSGKCSIGDEKNISNIYNEKELKQLLQNNRKQSNYEKRSKNKNSPLKSKSPQIKPLVMRSGSTNPLVYMKYKKKAKSMALNETEMKNINALAEKIIKKIEKLQDLNNFNSLKSFHDISQIINSFDQEDSIQLKNLFLDDDGKRQLNSNLTASLLFQNFFIDNFKFNDPNADKESLKVNRKLIKLCEKFKAAVKELNFEKKVKFFKKEQDHIIDDQKKMRELQNEVIRSMDIRKRSNMRFNFKQNEKLQGEIGKHNNPYDIVKVLRKFEVNYGSLKINQNKRVMGEVLNDMIFGVKSTLISMDQNDNNIFYSIK